MMIVWFIVGILIAGLMIVSQWSDVSSIKSNAQASNHKSLSFHRFLRMILVSIMLFSIFYLEFKNGLIALAGFWLCRTTVLVVINHQQQQSSVLEKE